MRISDWSSDVCSSDLDVGAAARSARSAAAEDVAEDVAEDIAHVGAAETARTGVAAAHAVLERGVAVLVVHAALAAVRQHLVRLLALLERLDRAGVARVAVGVVLHRAADRKSTRLNSSH